jgi:hypothetical protein
MQQVRSQRDRRFEYLKVQLGDVRIVLCHRGIWHSFTAKMAKVTKLATLAALLVSAMVSADTKPHIIFIIGNQRRCAPARFSTFLEDYM